MKKPKGGSIDAALAPAVERRYIPNSFQTPNAVVDQAMALMTGAQLKCYLAVIRKTTGWHKDDDGISISQFTEMTGIKRPETIRAALRWLENHTPPLVVRTTVPGRWSQYSANLGALSNIEHQETDAPDPNLKTDPPRKSGPHSETEGGQEAVDKPVDNSDTPLAKPTPSPLANPSDTPLENRGDTPLAKPSPQNTLNKTQKKHTKQNGRGPVDNSIPELGIEDRVDDLTTEIEIPFDFEPSPGSVFQVRGELEDQGVDLLWFADFYRTRLASYVQYHRGKGTRRTLQDYKKAFLNELRKFDPQRHQKDYSKKPFSNAATAFSQSHKPAKRPEYRSADPETTRSGIKQARNKITR